jgi:hypothetical protein
MARRRGRTIGLVVFTAIVTLFTGVCSFQILAQAWAKPVVHTTIECRSGLSALIAAVRRARVAASKVSGERAALAEFRSALEPEWSMRPALDDHCSRDADALKGLGEIDRLRYAEEHALRYEALDVASRRTRVETLETKLRERR